MSPTKNISQQRSNLKFLYLILSRKKPPISFGQLYLWRFCLCARTCVLIDSNVVFLWQGYGRSLWLMHGFFRANGGCGYVKKPDFLMEVGENNEVFNPIESLQVKKTLKVKPLLTSYCI